MTRLSRPGAFGLRAPRLGIALGRGTLWAALAPTRSGAAPRVWTRPVEPLEDGRTSWDELAEAVRELCAELGVRRPRLRIVLLPDLVHVRRVDLPRMSDEEMRRVLSRDASRFFIGIREPHTAATLALVNGRASPVPVLAVAAPSRILDAVDAATRAAGCTLEAFVPACVAWASATSPGDSGAPRVIAVLGGERIDVLRIREDRVERIRRAPRTPDWDVALPRLCASAAAESGDGSDPVRIIGPSDLVALATATLREGGFSPHGGGESPEATAALGALRANGPWLTAPSAATTARRRARRFASIAGVAAAALFAVAAALELWGARRELAAVRAARSEIRSSVDQVLMAKTAISALEARVGVIADAERSSPRWSHVIAGVAEHLPLDAHVSSFRGAADSLEVEGVALEAAGVFEAMRRMPGLSAVRAEAPIRREMQDGQLSVERFTLGARLAGLAPAESVRADAGGGAEAGP